MVLTTTLAIVLVIKAMSHLMIVSFMSHEIKVFIYVLIDKNCDQTNNEMHQILPPMQNDYAIRDAFRLLPSVTGAVLTQSLQFLVCMFMFDMLF